MAKKAPHIAVLSAVEFGRFEVAEIVGPVRRTELRIVGTGVKIPLSIVFYYFFKTR